ncbi:MAG: hypothetical protein NZ958_04115 [Bacteroidia bacterium]|nr:hypothetical protein [Bacteroidia bacterium]MDW8088403.1 hypothetical protein [Bacteroidia bacterium]
MPHPVWRSIEPYLILLKAYKWHLSTFVLSLTGILGLLLLYLPPSYVCEMEFVPPDFSVASPLLKNAALVPGGSSDLERLYSYLQSYSLQQMVIDSFNLYRYYQLEDIPSPARRARKVRRILERNLSVRITRNATLLVSVKDTSPQMAYRMTVFIKRKVEEFCLSLIGAQKALTETTERLRAVLDEINRLEKDIAEVRTKYKIITSSPQTSLFPFVPTPESFVYYDYVLSRETRLTQLQQIYATLLEEKLRREELARIYAKPIFIIEPPYYPLYPVGPSRWILLLVGALGALALGLGALGYFYHLGWVSVPYPQAEAVES